MSQAMLLPPYGNTVDAPRLRIKAGGIAVPWPIEASITQTNQWEASRFACGIALQDTDAMNAAWWFAQTDVRIEIDISIDGGASWTSILSGVTDDLNYDFAANYLTLSGRDLAALLIDQKTASSYGNMTSSEIATALASAAGLGTSHITATKTPVGDYYASNHVRQDGGNLSRAVTQWDLLIWLAQQEGFDLFVQGSDLYFQPPQISTAIPFQVMVARGAGGARANVDNLQMRRSLTLAKDVKVTVKSVNSYAGQTYTATATSPAVGKAAGQTQSYVFYKPNLTLAQAQNYANQRLAEITRHERVVEFECAGELSLTPFGVVRVSGTGTSFDQLYYPDQITRSIDFTSGFKQHVVAKNHTASEQIALASGSTGAQGLDYLTGGQ